MNISFLTGVSVLSPIKAKKAIPIRQQGLQKDTFEKSITKEEQEQKSSSLDMESIRQELTTMTTFNGKQKFKDDKLEEITKIIEENPEKWESVKTLSQQPKMISSLIIDFASRDAETLKAVTELSVLEKEDGSPKFSPLAIKNLANQLNGEQLPKVGHLADTPLDSDEIIAIAKDERLTDMDKLATKVNQFAKSSPDIRRVSFQQDEYDENAYTIRADLANNGSKILLLDKNLDDRALEIVEMQTAPNGALLQIKKSNDFKTNTVSKVTAEVNKSLPQPVVTEEVRVIKDENGKTVRKELYSLSDIAGTPNIKYVYPDGTEKIISSGEVDSKTGVKTVNKDMVSLDGTRTEYLFEDDPNGNMISEYRVTDKDGNVLLDNNLTFEVIDENTFISTENDKKYQININGDNISVTNLKNGEVTTLDIDTMADGNREKLMTSFKRMPAEEIISIGRTTKSLTGIDNTYQSSYAATTKTIKSGDNLFTILHEAGHAKDFEGVDVKNKETLTKAINSNPEVEKIFEEEKAAFNKAFPLSQREHISYFIKTSEYNDGLQEAIAETNALLNTKCTEDLFSIRSHYLQQYFPRTIVLLSKIMD